MKKEGTKTVLSQSKSAPSDSGNDGGATGASTTTT